MARNREQTTRDILEATGALLSRSGFRGLGVNAVAREAGVDKVLIYRYFGGLAELLEAFAEQGDFWPSDEELFGASAPDAAPPPGALVDRFARVVTRFAQALRRRPTTQEILRWELLEQNELTDALTTARERQGVRLVQELPAEAGVDMPAIASILAAGITYLVLRSKTAATYNGIDLRSEAGWARLEKAAELLVRLSFAAAERSRKAAPAPGRARKAGRTT